MLYVETMVNTSILYDAIFERMFFLFCDILRGVEQALELGRKPVFAVQLRAWARSIMGADGEEPLG